MGVDARALALALPSLLYRGFVAGALLFIAHYPAMLGAALVARAVLRPEDAPALVLVAGILVATHTGWREGVYRYCARRPLGAWLMTAPKPS